jgi:hypothetical protein
MKKLAHYRKSAIAAIGLAATFGAVFAPENKYVIAGIAIATAFGVYRVPNVPKPPPVTGDVTGVTVTNSGPAGP